MVSISAFSMSTKTRSEYVFRVDAAETCREIQPLVEELLRKDNLLLQSLSKLLPGREDHRGF